MIIYNTVDYSDNLGIWIASQARFYCSIFLWNEPKKRPILSIFRVCKFTAVYLAITGTTEFNSESLRSFRAWADITEQCQYLTHVVWKYTNKRYMARLRKTFVLYHGDCILIMLPEIKTFFFQFQVCIYLF